jgi:hypothetical protein
MIISTIRAASLHRPLPKTPVSLRLELTVYVPAGERAEQLLGIKPGSAIVGRPVSPDRVRVDYEGGIYARADDEFAAYSARLRHAADRHLWNAGRGYPTVARQTVGASLLCPVGTYDHAVRLLAVCDPARFDAWVNRWTPGR